MPLLSNILDSVIGADASVAQHHHTSFDAASPGDLEFREYYAAACPHCKHLDPAWQAAAAKVQASGGKVTFRQIECNDEQWNPVPENAQLCEGIAGFPTMKMFRGDKELQEYYGGRSASDLIDFVTNFKEDVAQGSMPLGALAIAAVAGASFMKDSEEKKKEDTKHFL